jgi:hypothetical protein
VINAFLIEELDHHLLGGGKNSAITTGSFDRSNPLGDSSIVARKFAHDYVSKENLPLTFLIASCPLVLGLLNGQLSDVPYRSGRKGVMSEQPQSIHENMIKKLQEFGAVNESLCDDVTWSLLNNVTIAGPKMQNNSQTDQLDDAK